MQSSLLFLSSFNLTKENYPNSISFTVEDRPMILNLVSVDNQNCFFSINFFNSYFYTIMISLNNLGKLSSHIPNNSEYEPNICALLSKVDIAIELNNFKSPVTLRIYSQLHDQILLTLGFSWMSPDMQVRNHYLSYPQIKKTANEISKCKSGLAALFDNSAITKLVSKCHKLIDKVNLHQEQLTQLISSNRPPSQSLRIVGPKELSTSPKTNLTYQNQVNECLNKIADLNKVNSNFELDLKSKMNAASAKLKCQSESIIEMKSRIKAIDKMPDRTQKNLLTNKELEILQKQFLSMKKEWNNKISEHTLQLTTQAKKYNSLQDIIDNVMKEVSTRNLEINQRIKELSMLIPPVLPDEFHSDFSQKILKNKNIMLACQMLSETEYALGCSEGNIEIRCVNTHNVLNVINDESKCCIYTLILVKNLIITGGDDNKIKVWDWKNKRKCINTLIGHSSRIWTLVHIKEKMIASGSSDCLINIWNIDKKECLHTLNGHTSKVHGLLMYDKHTLLSVSYDSTIRLWKLADVLVESDNTLCITDANNDGITSVLQLSKFTVIVGTPNGKLKIWDISAKLLLHTFDMSSDCIKQIIRLSPTLVASCSDDKTISVWDISSNTRFLHLLGHDNYVFGLLKLNNSQLLSVSQDNTLRIWGTKNNILKK